MGTDNTQFFLEFCVWRRKVRERNSDFSLRSMELGWSSRIRPRIKVGVLGEGYTWIPETPSFPMFHVGGSGSRKLRVQEVSTGLPWVITHTSRGREPSYSGLFPI